MNEDRGSRLVWWVAGAIVLGLMAYRFLPRMENPLAPEPVAAFVAVQVEGSPEATDGTLTIAAGVPFRLFAVLEARSWNGASVWYTQAPALVLGGARIAADRLRPWPAEKVARVRWFTVEGFAPYLRVERPADLDRFALVENFHPEWGYDWSAEGRVDPRLAQLGADSPLRPLPFGVQRFEARIELFDAPQALTPRARFQSAGPEGFERAEPGATRVVAAVPGALSELTAAFGRVEVEAAEGLPPEVPARVGELERRELAFVRTRLLARHIEAAGRVPAELAWRTVDLDRQALEWGRDAAAGDLLQSGPRIVALFRDQGEPGRLDAADLVIDLAKGLHIRRIDEVYEREGGLELSFARLGG